MTDLSITEIYAIGAPIVLAMILFEALFSSAYNKNLYKKDDTLCTVGLLTGNVLMVFALKGATLALHFYLFQFKLINLSELMPICYFFIPPKSSKNAYSRAYSLYLRNLPDFPLCPASMFICKYSLL